MFPSKTKPRLLSDENIPIGLVDLLVDEGFDIKKVELGSKDRRIFELAKSEKRALLTLDKHFSNKDKFSPKESFGIIFIKINPPLIDSISFSLEKLFNVVESAKLRGRLFTLTNSGFKVFPKL